MQIRIDSEFQSLIPALAPEERAQLEANLLRDGCRDPLVGWLQEPEECENECENPRWEREWYNCPDLQSDELYWRCQECEQWCFDDSGILIDGHNRYEICERLGIEYSVKEMEFADRDEAMLWIKKNQLGRRNLAAFLRAEYQMDIDEWEQRKAKAKENQIGALKQFQNEDVVEEDEETVFQNSEKREQSINTTKELAAKIGVSSDTASRIIKIREKAPEEVKEKLRAGHVSINEVFTQIRQIEKQEKLADAKEKINAVARANPDKPVVALADSLQWLPTQDDCDLLITDPPYSTDVDDIETFAATWLPLALSKVKSTGRAYVCIGAYPHEIAAYLSAAALAGHAMKLQQILVWTYRNTLGPSPKMDYKLNWQAILYFRGADAPELDCPVMNEQFSVQDINAPDGRQGDRYHAWQKPDELAERLIRHSTAEGARVLDPFCGTGTFVLAAARLGRKGFGCDLSDEMLQTAAERGCDYAK